MLAGRVVSSWYLLHSCFLDGHERSDLGWKSLKRGLCTSVFCALGTFLLSNIQEARTSTWLKCLFSKLFKESHQFPCVHSVTLGCVEWDMQCEPPQEHEMEPSAPWKGASRRPSGRLEHYVSGDDSSRPLASLPCPLDAASGFLSPWGPFFVMPCLFSCVDFGRSFRKFAMVLLYMLILNSFIEGSRRNWVINVH